MDAESLFDPLGALGWREIGTHVNSLSLPLIGNDLYQPGVVIGIFISKDWSRLEADLAEILLTGSSRPKADIGQRGLVKCVCPEANEGGHWVMNF